MDLLLFNFERKHSIVIVGIVVQLCWHYFEGCESSPSDGDIRLVGGSVPIEGRVEVYHNGQWGTVCDDFWDDKEAAVVCRQLGHYENGTALFQSSFGEGSGTIWLDNVQCDGSEYLITTCNHRRWGLHNCDHTEDAGVACNPDEDGVRLVGGTTSREGRVEVSRDGIWYTVCDDRWDDADAEVVCRQLGYNTHGAAALSHAAFGEGRGSIWTKNIACFGTETSLQDCTQTYESRTCNHGEDAGVRCLLDENDMDPSQEIRLVGGTVPQEGRVEVYNANDNSWSTVCDDDWDDKDAVVVCRQLGFNTGGTAVGHATFGDGTGPIKRGGIDCAGEEDNLTDCRNAEYRSMSYCDHTEDAGVRCNDVRLSYGGSLYEGRVEVYREGEWGTVCDDAWDDADARVVCRQLGFATGGISILRSFYGSTPTRIQLRKPDCSGDETSILDCKNSGWSGGISFLWSDDDVKCHTDEEVGVSCYEVVTIAISFVFMLGVTAGLVCLLICIRQMKLALSSNVNGSPNFIQMMSSSQQMWNGREEVEYGFKDVISDLPDRYNIRSEGLTSAFQNTFSSDKQTSKAELPVATIKIDKAYYSPVKSTHV